MYFVLWFQLSQLISKSGLDYKIKLILSKNSNRKYYLGKCVNFRNLGLWYFSSNILNIRLYNIY